MTYDPTNHPSMPQQAFRADWSLREYSVPAPRRIPPAPTFQGWVPAPDTIAFGELPRTFRYEVGDKASAVIAAQAAKPVPPKPVGVALPQQNARPEWTLRDYSANQDCFSVFAVPKLPPLNPNTVPIPRGIDWSLRDYSANQDTFSARFGTVFVPSIYVPAPEVIAFGELPRNWAVYMQPFAPCVTPASPASSKPLPALVVVSYPTPVRDQTPERLVIAENRATYLAIPTVPANATWTFEYEALDSTPYQRSLQPQFLPQQAGPQIPPPPVTYLPPPPWSLRDYMAYQDGFSAVETGNQVNLPKGLRPYFPFLEAQRDLPRATLLVQNFILPPRPPFVFAPAPTQVETAPWHWLNYQDLSDHFTAWVNSIPLLPGFRVMAMQAGVYAGVFYQAGDVFDLAFAHDYSAYNVNYGPNAFTQQFGWMQIVAPTTPLFNARSAQTIPLFPLNDQLPIRRWTY